MTVHLRVREFLPAYREEAFDPIHDYPLPLQGRASPNESPAGP